MAAVTSFPPIAHASAKLLILGSMPGVASLKADQYYAHPRNAFWPIMNHLFHIDVDAPYEARVNALKKAQVAVWDVLQQCERRGSLDSAIKRGTRIANNFDAFLKQYPHISLIAFNGAEAENSFKKHALPELNSDELQLIRLPSTSPAHTMPLAQKVAAWRAGLNVKYSSLK